MLIIKHFMVVIIIFNNCSVVANYEKFKIKTTFPDRFLFNKTIIIFFYNKIIIINYYYYFIIIK